MICFERPGLLRLGQSFQRISQGLRPVLEVRLANFPIRGIDADAVGTDIQQNTFQVGNDLVVLGFG